mgnify:CR=1 FL=1
MNKLKKGVFKLNITIIMLMLYTASAYSKPIHEYFENIEPLLKVSLRQHSLTYLF